MYRHIIASVALLGAATAASAFTFTTAPGAPDPGALANQTHVLTYDTVPGAVILSGNYQIVTGTVPSQYAAPALDDTAYFSVPKSGSTGSADVWIADWLPNRVTDFSFYWGSVDTYNSIDLLDRSGAVFATINGGDMPPADGDQSAASTNMRIYVTMGAGEDLGGLRFNSTGIAFEHDDLAFGVVPEPAAWAMLIAGFGLVGTSLRRRRRVVSC